MAWSNVGLNSHQRHHLAPPRALIRRHQRRARCTNKVHYSDTLSNGCSKRHGENTLKQYLDAASCPTLGVTHRKASGSLLFFASLLLSPAKAPPARRHSWLLACFNAPHLSATRPFTFFPRGAREGGLFTPDASGTLRGGVW